MVLGVDDWAWRKGQRYGTILCDLQLHRIVDLLPERSAPLFSSWLMEHPGIEVVSRDRAGCYSQAAAEGAPSVVPMPDAVVAADDPGPNLRRFSMRISASRIRRMLRSGIAAEMENTSRSARAAWCIGQPARSTAKQRAINQPRIFSLSDCRHTVAA
jgi:hypothetical protein